ncbi:DUF4340 domain-containing protein [Fournierella sp.]|uniref:DUF4340 domain-containing protein n=1 Tax=Allofournierella sp. TaxID=1940256 RepID=UPI0025C6EB08|nr:DUF4340 domain-containing protein [Fournierella sp.]
MKAKRNLMIGLVILLVILAAGVFAAKTISDKDAAASASADAAISLTSITASSEIESFGYTFEGDTLTFEQRQEVVEDESASDNTSEAASDSTSTAGSEETEPETETVWYLVDDPEYKLDQSTVNSMLTAFVNLEASRQLTETSEEYGLEEPTLTFWMTANGETTTWSCGATNDMTGTVYLQKQGEDTVYLVHTNKVTIFEKGRMELGDTSDATGDIASSEEVTSEVTSSETAASEAASAE